MDILLCCNCGYVGAGVDVWKVSLDKVKDVVKPGLYKIWKGLNVEFFVCPRCNSPHIGHIHKSEQIPEITIPTVWTYPSLDDTNEIKTVSNDVETITSIYKDESEDEPEKEIHKLDIDSQSHQKTAPVTNMKTVRPPKIYRIRACDICNSPFNSRVEGATRCPDCLKKTMRGLWGNNERG